MCRESVREPTHFLSGYFFSITAFAKWSKAISKINRPDLAYFGRADRPYIDFTSLITIWGLMYFTVAPVVQLVVYNNLSVNLLSTNRQQVKMAGIVCFRTKTSTCNIIADDLRLEKQKPTEMFNCAQKANKTETKNDYIFLKGESNNEVMYDSNRSAFHHDNANTSTTKRRGR